MTMESRKKAEVVEKKLTFMALISKMVVIVATTATGRDTVEARVCDIYIRGVKRIVWLDLNPMVEIDEWRRLWFVGEESTEQRLSNSSN